MSNGTHESLQFSNETVVRKRFGKKKIYFLPEENKYYIENTYSMYLLVIYNVILAQKL